MTYEQAYRQCKTQDELMQAIKKDVNIALLFVPDALPYIKEAAETVLNAKYNTSLIKLNEENEKKEGLI